MNLERSVELMERYSTCHKEMNEKINEVTVRELTCC